MQNVPMMPLPPSDGLLVVFVEVILIDGVSGSPLRPSEIVPPRLEVYNKSTA